MSTTQQKLEIAAIALTQRCNLACSHCADTASGNRRNSTSHEIGRPLLHSLFKQFYGLGVRQVILSGGEPLLRNDLLEIIGDVGKAGLSCALLTNGTLLTRALLKRLKSTGVVDYLRLSVEYPEGAAGEIVRNHDAVQTFRMVSAVKEAELVAGINMTLMPGNLKYIGELAAESKAAGAAFFRAVPVLPSGRCATIHLPHSFNTACIKAMLSLQATYRNREGTDHGRISKLTSSQSKSFIAPCCGGGRTLSITADGRAHLCSMADLGGKPVYITDHSVAECLRKLSRRRMYLQKKNVVFPGSSCQNCRFVAECRGGCLSERAARGGNGGQHSCVHKSWESVIAGCRSHERMIKAATVIVDEYDDFLRDNPPVPCVRALPYWVIHF